MKPALVLGLALAANAMAADSNNNELFVTPTGKLGDLAQRFPGKIMYDEVADDELAVALAPRSVFKSDEEYKKYIYSMRNSWDDAADDEFAVKLLSRDRFKTEEEYQKYYNRARFTLDDAADDELFAMKKPADDELWAGIGADGKGTLTTGRWKIPPGQWKFASGQYPKLIADDEELFFAPGQRIGNLAGPYPTLNFDEVADDELAVMIAPRSRFNSDEEYEKYKIRMRRSWDDAADDELAVKIVNLPAEHVAFDDDELMRGIPPVENFKSYEDWLRFTRRMSEEADNELGLKIVHLPVESVAYDDDEFSAYVPIVLAKYDEVADDELAYLGHLLNEKVQTRISDEFKKAEKPSHGKTKEKTQMKRKLRPVVDEIPLAQN